MKRFFLVWMMFLAGLTNYSKVSENCIEPLIIGDQGYTIQNFCFSEAYFSEAYFSGAYFSEAYFSEAYLTEDLFTIPADGTIFVSQTGDAFTGYYFNE